ncbi:MAG TPA: RebB family R body protein [Verrucomicrobiae bacterium]|nr:RebB family R body protein [Verrucomicrobiae bacterium]
MPELPNNQLPDSVIQSLAITNLKSVGEQPAMLSNLAYSNTIANTNLSQQNAVANQQAMNELAIAVVGKIVNSLTNLGPLEARSAVDVLTNNELAQTIADLKATLQAFNTVQAKPATPPSPATP